MSPEAKALLETAVLLIQEADRLQQIAVESNAVSYRIHTELEDAAESIQDLINA